MKRSTLAVLLPLATVPCVAALSEPAGLQPKLRPSADEQPAFMLNAQGVQVYACKPKADNSNEYAWAFVAPEATLSERGASVGRHFAGPTWESSSDRSSVKGAARAGQDGGGGNVPWLMLAATPSGSDGKFAGVTSILRVATKGGVAPTGACDASKSGQEMRVPYTAEYYFYKKK